MWQDCSGERRLLSRGPLCLVKFLPFTGQILKRADCRINHRMLWQCLEMFISKFSPEAACGEGGILYTMPFKYMVPLTLPASLYSSYRPMCQSKSWGHSNSISPLLLTLIRQVAPWMNTGLCLTIWCDKNQASSGLMYYFSKSLCVYAYTPTGFDAALHREHRILLWTADGERQWYQRLSYLYLRQCFGSLPISALIYYSQYYHTWNMFCWN